MAKCVYDGKGYLPECEHCIDTVGTGVVCTHDCVIELREEIEKRDSLIKAKDAEISELRECLRISSNAMEMVVQWLGKYPAWQECLKNCVARNRNAMEGDAK